VAALPTRDQRPRILGGPGALHLHIHYPAAARRQGIEGRLVVTFTVHPDGWARHIRVDKPLHPLCDSAAVAAIRAVRFRPGTYEGAPVPVRMSLPVRFQLQASTPPAERRRRTASTHP
jgi:TonB family protein